LTVVTKNVAPRSSYGTDVVMVFGVVSPKSFWPRKNSRVTASAISYEFLSDEYYARTHLHQEAVRDLLFGHVTDHIAMIDKMLGLYRLRQLIESLPIATVNRR
jgi:hypothetical protein